MTNAPLSASVTRKVATGGTLVSKETQMESIQITDQQSASVAASPSTRVSLEEIEANILAEYNFLAGSAIKDCVYPSPLDLMTICIIVCRNGFTVIGKSAPADEANFNAELGAKFAREDAIRQLWPLMGYALRERLRK